MDGTGINCRFSESPRRWDISQHRFANTMHVLDSLPINKLKAKTSVIPRCHLAITAYTPTSLLMFEKLGNWYPIQHGSEESDSATERKVAQVTEERRDITDVIAVHEPSPA